MDKKYSPATLAAHLGRNRKASAGYVNLPIYHGSTVLYDSYEDLMASPEKRRELYQVTYGRLGTPSSFALEQAIAEMEGGFAAVTASSGLGAITSAMLAFVKSGDHILMVDSVYHPTRHFCDTMLKRMGVETTYYDPCVGNGIEELIRPNTSLIFLESPGSQTFEIQDIPAITSVAKEHGIVTAIDNTWATPVYLNPFDLGVDVSIHAATKYITGHSDAMLGIITVNEKHYWTVRDNVVELGQCAGPDTIFLGLRGLRTMPTRLQQHWKSGLEIANWLLGCPEVSRVIHPALPGDSGHTLWKRDFTGASGLFAFETHETSEAAVAALINSVELFGIGYSWGGFESLILPAFPNIYRSVKKWNEDKQLFRVHIGLEDVNELKADLETGFEAMNRAIRA